MAETITAADSTATIAIELEPLTQRLIPDFVQFLRSQGVAGIEGNNVSYAGALFVLVDGNDAAGLFVGSRTFSLRAGERYGVFFPAVPLGATTPQETWLHGLRQDSENRTNLALVNTGEIDTTTNEFEIEIFDGSTGVKLTTLGWSLSAPGVGGRSTVCWRITRQESVMPISTLSKSLDLTPSSPMPSSTTALFLATAQGTERSFRVHHKRGAIDCPTLTEASGAVTMPPVRTSQSLYPSSTLPIQLISPCEATTGPGD